MPLLLHPDTVADSVSHVEFEIIPARALLGTSGALNPETLANTPWWQGVPLSPDFRSWLDGIGQKGPAQASGSETWGQPDGSRMEVRSSTAGVTTIRAHVDVRRLDARFGAALLMLVRQLGAALVRRDGVVIEPTIGAFGAALRGTAAWRSSNDPATWRASQADDADS